MRSIGSDGVDGDKDGETFLTAYIKGTENEQPHRYRLTRSEMQRIPGRAAGEVERTAAKGLAGTTLCASPLLVTADLEPKHGGPIRRHRQDVESEPRSNRGVFDCVNRELWGQAMQQEFEGLEGSGTSNPAESPKGECGGGERHLIMQKKKRAFGDHLARIQTGSPEEPPAGGRRVPEYMAFGCQYDTGCHLDFNIASSPSADCAAFVRLLRKPLLINNIGKLTVSKG